MNNTIKYYKFKHPTNLQMFPNTHLSVLKIKINSIKKKKSLFKIIWEIILSYNTHFLEMYKL